MADKFDPYREALIVETVTVWPDACADVDPGKRRQIAAKLHADPAPCTNLEYVRVHTGFCRKITVSAEDIQRVSP